MHLTGYLDSAVAKVCVLIIVCLPVVMRCTLLFRRYLKPQYRIPENNVALTNANLDKDSSGCSPCAKSAVRVDGKRAVLDFYVIKPNQITNWFKFNHNVQVCMEWAANAVAIFCSMHYYLSMFFLSSNSCYAMIAPPFRTPSRHSRSSLVHYNNGHVYFVVRKRGSPPC
jgi:hypothetical protein